MIQSHILSARLTFDPLAISHASNISILGKVRLAP